ncbi:MAG TPA: transglutaminaseTgpA domain-containing protein, partial [Thermopolyspora sp.]
MKPQIAAGVATATVSITLYPLFAGSTWFWTGLGAVIAITGVGMLASRYAVDRRLVPLAELVVLGWFLTVAYAGDDAWARIVPTKHALHTLLDLLGDGFGAIQRYSAPVPDEPGISLLTAGGIGLVAILVDLCAVRLRRAAL